MSAKPRKSLTEMASRDEPKQIAGHPADQCPYCGCVGMRTGNVEATATLITRYVYCRNPNCGKSFLSSQQPAKLVREIT